MDRFLSRFLSWGLFAISLIAFGAISAFYFVFCWLVSGFIDARLLRVEREETLRHAGVPEDEIDGRLLPRDRIVAISRGCFALMVAALFHYFA